MPIPNLWSKLEDAGDVISPQLGAGGAEVGSPTYLPAKFNNGILSDVNDEGCTFPTAANSLNADKGTIEFWAKLNFAPDHGADHYLFSFKQTVSPFGGLRLYFMYTLDHFRLNTRIGISITETDFVWNAGDLVHFAAVWDRQGNDIGGGKTLALYINNVLKVSTTETWDTSPVNTNLFIGTDRAGAYHSDGVIDNLKTYDVCKIDFSDRGYEGIEEVFGKTIKGLTGYLALSNYIRCLTATSGSAGPLASISIYLAVDDLPYNVKCAIYDSSWNKLANSETEERLIAAHTDQWQVFNFGATKPVVLAATTYYLAWWSSGSVNVYQDTVEGTYNYESVAYNGWPASLTPTPGTREISIFATYGEAPPLGVKTLVQATLISLAPLIAIPTLGQIIKFAGG